MQSKTSNIVMGLVWGVVLCGLVWAFSLTPFGHIVAKGLGIE
jgi:sulfite exporter TauE/SafE